MHPIRRASASNLPRREADGGYTLIEVMVVVGIIAVIAAIAMPQLLPALTFSTHEGAARRLLGYGRSAFSYANWVHERLTVKFDLKEQQYWTERWPEPEEDEEDEDAVKTEDKKEEMSTLDVLAMAQKAMDPEGEATEDDKKALEEQANRMNKRFERIQRQTLLAQAEHIVHDGIGELGDGLFNKTYDEETGKEKEIEPEVVTEPTLLRAAMPNGTFVESILVGEERFTKGIVEIEIGPLGLTEPVEMVVGNDEGDYYTVIWDAITGDARFYEGKKAPERKDE